jgi:hypothetical protein
MFAFVSFLDLLDSLSLPSYLSLCISLSLSLSLSTQGGKTWNPLEKLVGIKGKEKQGFKDRK